MRRVDGIRWDAHLKYRNPPVAFNHSMMRQGVNYTRGYDVVAGARRLERGDVVA